jgi:hypothetical protein
VNTAATIRTHPALLLLGVIGFALRGGIVFLIAPILILPTSVEVRLLLGGNLGSTGLAAGFYVAVVALSVLTLLAAAAVLYVLSRCEVALFGRFVNSHEPSAEHAWLPPGRLDNAQRSGVVPRVFIVQALALLAILVAAVPLAAAIGQATLQEILLPSSVDTIYLRIARDVAVPFIGWVGAIVLVEAISAVVTRRVLAGAFGLRVHAGISRHPLRAVLVASIGWLLFIGAVVLALVVLAVAWDAVRSVFLSTGLSGGLRDVASGVLVALLFGTVFTAALALCGLVSTLRAGLWTLASLR